MIENAPEFMNHLFLKKNKIAFRQYQHDIFEQCKNKNSLVVLPTGLGKTIIAILMISNSLKKYNGKAKTIILAPTRPLVSQHESSCKRFLKIDQEDICLLTGRVKPEQRILAFQKAKVIISTPQVIKNDLMRGRYGLESTALIIFDEAHRAKGNYSYTYISEQYIRTCSDPLILALTASPGKDEEKIQELCHNLYIENIAFKTYNDEDVKNHINDIETITETVELPLYYLEICEIWNHLFKKFLNFFIDRELINPFKKYYSKLDFLHICEDLSFALRYDGYTDNYLEDTESHDDVFHYFQKFIQKIRNNNLNIHSIFSYCSTCISILHAKELLETQDIELFKSFLNRIEYKAAQDNQSAKRISTSKHWNFMKSMLDDEEYSHLTHPKIDKLIEIIDEEQDLYKNRKLIVFTQYREMAELLKKELTLTFADLKINKFIGQASKHDDLGFSQDKQIELLDEFRNGNINILIATSVAEEGLDIPNVDAIIFYEPVPSEIRMIQRRGRTGRARTGRCYILITNSTSDVPFYKAACRKEKNMNIALQYPEDLIPANNFKRNKIDLSNSEKISSDYEILKNFRERRSKEKELLANKAIEEILEEIDNFAQSSKYQKLKECGVTFYHDLLNIDQKQLKSKILKIKGKTTSSQKNPRKRLSKKLKTLINITKIYCKNNRILSSKLKSLANDEDIADHVFHKYLNQACYLGYLKKDKNYIELVEE